MTNTKYIYYGLNLTSNQLEKIIKASKNHERGKTTYIEG